MSECLADSPNVQVTKYSYNFCTDNFLVYIGVFTLIELDSYISGA